MRPRGLSAKRPVRRAEREAAREAAKAARELEPLQLAEIGPSRTIDVAPAVIRSATDDEDFPNSHHPLTHGFTNDMLRP